MQYDVARSQVHGKNVQCSALKCIIGQDSKVKCSYMQYRSRKYSKVQYKANTYSIVQYTAVKDKDYSVVQYSAVQALKKVKCSAVQFSTWQDSTG